MFADIDSEIIVGFLSPDGFLTQSTGIMAASCSNILGNPFGDNTYAVFDVGDDRIWQIYGTNSIIEQTMTSLDWNIGDDISDNLNTNGTLAVIDRILGTQSFIWTSEIGLTAGPTNSNIVLNRVKHGGRNELAGEHQVLLKYIDGGEYPEGFNLVYKFGVSPFIEFFPGLSPSSTYLLDNYMIGSEMLSFYFRDELTNFARIKNYRISDLVEINDYDTGIDSNLIGVSLYNNRCIIVEDGGPTRNIKLVGVNGIEDFSVNVDSMSWRSNDPYEND